jgi:hypothetical protein
VYLITSIIAANAANEFGDQFKEYWDSKLKFWCVSKGKLNQNMVQISWKKSGNDKS